MVQPIKSENLLATMDRIRKQVTGHSKPEKSDGIQEEQLRAGHNGAERTYVWFFCFSGGEKFGRDVTCTEALLEKDALFIDQSPERNALGGFVMKAPTSKFLTFEVIITGINNGRLVGELFVVEHEKYFAYIKEESISAYATMLFENGEIDTPANYIDMILHRTRTKNPHLGQYLGKTWHISEEDASKLRHLKEQ